MMLRPTVCTTKEKVFLIYPGVVDALRERSTKSFSVSCVKTVTVWYASKKIFFGGTLGGLKRHLALPNFSAKMVTT